MHDPADPIEEAMRAESWWLGGHRRIRFNDAVGVARDLVAAEKERVEQVERRRLTGNLSVIRRMERDAERERCIAIVEAIEPWDPESAEFKRLSLALLRSSASPTSPLPEQGES